MQYKLILYNDDVHSFEQIIAALVTICGHEIDQAEQCAYIVHYKNSCVIKVGDTDDLVPMADQLRSTGMDTLITTKLPTFKRL